MPTSILARDGNPFHKSDRVLLVGEGDFSFARALIRRAALDFDHGARLTATTYDSRAECARKYPQAAGHIAEIQSAVSPHEDPRGRTKHDHAHTDDALQSDTNNDAPTPPAPDTATGASAAASESEDEFTGFSSSDVSSDEDNGDANTSSPAPEPQSSTHAANSAMPRPDPRVNILYDTDATKLRAQKALRAAAPFDRIVFNFPHVGGRSTDVNRQVRYNQELLVGFFASAKGLLRHNAGDAHAQARRKRRRARKPWLAPGGSGESSSDEEEEYEEDGGEKDHGEEGREKEQEGDREKEHEQRPASVLATLFDQYPYTLWNVKDLARHAGLVCARSFVFDWEGWPGYRHARTLGNVVAGRGKGREKRLENGSGEVDGDVDGEGKEGVEAVERGEGDPGEGELLDVDGESEATNARPGAWRAEERKARVYEFVLPEGDREVGRKGAGKRRGVKGSEGAESSGEEVPRARKGGGRGKKGAAKRAKR